MSTSKRTSLFLSQESIFFVEKRQRSYDASTPFSRVVNTAIDQLDLVLKDSTPDLANLQWAMIFNFFNGRMEHQHYTFQSAQEIADKLRSEYENGFGVLGESPEESDFDAISSMTIAQTICAVDIAMRFWHDQPSKLSMVNEIGGNNDFKTQAEWLGQK